MFRPHAWLYSIVLFLAASWPVELARGTPADRDLARQLRELDPNVFPPDGEKAKEFSRQTARDARARLQAANRRENRAWQEVQSRSDWEKYRDVRLQALREALGPFPPAPRDLKVRVTRTLQGDGYRIENLVFESRPGLVVTANLYAPARPAEAMPGILISHSHHNPKTQGELQDMGMTWARQGCMVLVMDQLGHGERRQHPFQSEKDYPQAFRPGRQDYYFRYNTGLELHVVGESLMGWMVWDLTRGVDLLLSRPGIDKDRIILLGSVAGGGDSAAVAAALDPRIKAVAPFNFGGPQPDYSIPADAERNFNYFGVPSWESTRCLRLGARDGFGQWLIVAAAAPRRLIYAHEFAWERERDPVWPRLQKVFEWYGAADHLAVALGKGTLKGSPPESSHCNNIGPLHRSGIYPALKPWFDMPIPTEYSQRRAANELLCLTPEVVKEFGARPLHELVADIAATRAAAARERLADLAPDARRKKLRAAWARLLGDVEPQVNTKVLEHKKQRASDLMVERIALGMQGEIVVPLVLLIPPAKPESRLPVVVALAQHGKQAFLEHRSEAIAELINGGSAVCLVDVRGTGETKPADGSRRHSGSATSLSATEWLLGQTLLGSRLRDVRAVLRYLRGRTDIDAARVGLWGDSFSPANAKDAKLAVPLDAANFPAQAEPLGGLLALFGALFEDSIRACYVHGGLSGYQSVLQSPFIYVPHDAMVPGALTEGDLCDVAAALAPHPLRLEALVDGLNRMVDADMLTKSYDVARAAYGSLKAESHLQISDTAPNERAAARWMLRQLNSD
jgi:cephalosporin-C deacetylase-like acetyl esterase